MMELRSSPISYFPAMHSPHPFAPVQYPESIVSGNLLLVQRRKYKQVNVKIMEV
jgi:hypothetical protein